MRLLFSIIGIFGCSVILWGCWAFNEQRKLSRKKKIRIRFGGYLQ